MTGSHIGQLTEWWENAEEGVIEKGDTVINRSESETTVYVATVRARRQHPSARILSRAPKPKPAWHDAVAVIAHIGGNELPRVLVRDNDGAFVDGITGSAYVADRLRDVTPLIEAKVTDEQAMTALNLYYEYESGDTEWPEDTIGQMRDAIAAALGIEAE